MARPRLRLLASSLALVSLLAASAGHAASFTSFWALGDSLSDDGNLYAATSDAPDGPTPPSPPYYEGRFSNGPVWAEHVADRFTAKSLATGNFAYGGSMAVPGVGDLVPSLPQQVGLFALNATGSLGNRPVVSIWSGANDLIAGVPLGHAVAAGRAAAASVTASAAALAAYGVHDVALFNLPDLGKVPLYALSGDPLAQARATRGSTAFNNALNWQIPKLEKLGVNVIKIDIATLFDDLIANPQAYGVKNATIPCLLPGAAPCSPSESLERAFFDPVHPNLIIHQQIADVVNQQIAPVPLPVPLVLLLAALGGLVVLPRASRRA